MQREDFLSVDQLATIIGCNRKTVYEGIAAGEIPAKRLGRKLVIYKPTVLAWLSSGQEPKKRKATR